MQGIVVQCIAKMELGGAQKRVIELMRETGERGYLVTGKGGKLYNEVKEEFGDKHITLLYLKREINPINDFLCFFELRNKLIELHRIYGNIILHTHGSKAGVIGRIVSGSLSFCYSIHTVHGYAISPYINTIKRSLYLNAERIASLFGDVIITQANIHIDRSIKWGIGRKNQFYHIPNFIKFQDFTPVDIKDNHETVICTIGNLKPQKNPTIWASVAKKVTSIHPNVTFIYIGDGPLRDEISKMISDNDHIKLLGWRNDIKELLNTANIFFLPSRWEGLPRTILEAMASGLPVVASCVDGTPEVVKDLVTGYIVSPDDIEGYVEKLSVLIEDRDERKRMGKRGRERVRKYFSYDSMIQTTMKIYREFSESVSKFTTNYI